VAALSEALVRVVGHCPAGPGLLLDALQLQISSARAWPCGAASPGPADPEGADARAAEADMRSARGAVRAWALVLQWLVQAAPRAAARSALTRLAGMAASLLCWPPLDDSEGASVAAPSMTRASVSASSIAGSGGLAHLPPLSRELSVQSVPGAPPRIDSPVLPGDGGDGPAEGSEGGQEAVAQGVCRPQGFLAGQQLMAQASLSSALGKGLRASARRRRRRRRQAR
jgi:hypothetical protein